MILHSRRTTPKQKTYTSVTIKAPVASADE